MFPSINHKFSNFPIFPNTKSNENNVDELRIISSATADVFQEVHRAKTDWTENTFLVLTDPKQFGWEYAPVPRVTLNTILFEKDSKHLDNLMKKLNPSQSVTLVEQPEELADHLPTTVGLFQVVQPPDCIQLVVDGWVTRHHTVSLDGADRTVIGSFTS